LRHGSQVWAVEFPARQHGPIVDPDMFVGISSSTTWDPVGAIANTVPVRG
jgi:hypothetical protein